jgi:hypothetical protein
MPNEQWRMDLKGDIRKVLEPLVAMSAHESAAAAALAAVLPHLEAAYRRGEMAGRSRAGYKIPTPRKESE